ncbi:MULTISPECIES: TetR/AcrR family transcriptional regulator [unclassified Crossiella]|uniref:TetR/AcrR family transcriptional regulator n=1 Tax=unclassified Crossiella TaxID=2620835 RepID=UPI001FFF4D06|nr:MULTISPECIES: TetR family transcriptional regulator [unclassified Crossiella]MCK2237848.1 TetR family transcriptional regulator [Crossiella sp. S99.2]MCK2255134.1 TetR family transcriptional regulator [Crossiella sp. S99.1]
MTQAPRTRGRLNRSLVLTKAIELMDAEGLDGLTIRALATALGAKPMAIYTYFAGKDELLTAAYAELVAAIPLPVIEDGIAGLKQNLRAHRAVMLAHPCVLPLVVRLDRPTEYNLRLNEAAFGVLLHLGLAPREAMLRASAASWLTLGSVTNSTAKAATNPVVLPSAADFSPETHPALHAVLSVLPGLNEEELFEAGLDLVLGPTSDR